MTLYPKLILDALATVRYPGTERILLRLKWLPTTSALME